MKTDSISLDSPIVSVKWLFKHLGASNLMVLDASMPSVVDIDHLHDATQIIGARFANLKQDFLDPAGAFPNTIPSAIQFQTAVRNLGIQEDSALIIYDSKGIYSSPRLWWLFKTFGHDQVAVLNGGLPEWIKHKFPTEQRTALSNKSNQFRAKQRAECIINFKQISAISQQSNRIIVDARSKARFEGKIAEPRKGLRSGNIPNSINLPYTDLLIDGKLKNKKTLQSIFAELGLIEKSLVFSCGSGITACIVALAACRLGVDDLAVYDGSWTEYATLTQ